ncbi:hypothetical protein CU098_010734 [Rhizopus stolonifer]|uniref:Uncharacterized protein n=1 Tax=Rhizopus stolonifer TaxID=4846 RepID=A0A367K849_RHIST|nr:hypothetical protein CU098_010734 [Rhizopus stolonifer]
MHTWFCILNSQETEAKEDVYHMIVECFIKSAYWINILRLMKLPNSFHNPETVWSALIYFSTTDTGDLIQPELLCAFGSGFATLW